MGQLGKIAGGKLHKQRQRGKSENSVWRAVRERLKPMQLTQALLKASPEHHESRLLQMPHALARLRRELKEHKSGGTKLM